AKLCPVVPGLGRVDLGMMAFGARGRGLYVGHFLGGIEIENALAGIANDGLLAGADFVVSLGPEHDAARHTLLIANFGEATAAKFGDALVMAEQVFVDAGANLIALGAPLGQQLFVLGGALAGFLFFLFDFGVFGFQFGLRGLDFLVARVGVDHQLENLVLVGGNFFFRELDLVQQRFVLVVGLDVEGLIAIFGDFAAEVGDRGFVLAAGGLVGLDGGLGLLHLRLRACQFLLDDGDALGKFRDLVLQTADLFVRVLQFQQIFDVRKHSALDSIDSSMCGRWLIDSRKP